VASAAIRTVVGGAVALATILVLVGAALVVFLNPVWVGLEQGRSDATGWTGWPMARVTDVTGTVLNDLIIGPPEFSVAVDGVPVLDERERGHMRDVRGVLIGFGVAALVAAGVLVVARLRSRGAPWFWRSVAAGAVVLAVGVVVIGAVFAFAFDAAFDVFHRVFFAGGSYSFDPRTERLVQLFPEQFWYETTIALGVVLLVLAGLATLGARGRTGGPRD
jgi:integral membrane protein (TIGR01906 family)